jgi:hypothetical protein
MYLWDWLTLLAVIGWVALLLHVPLFKPWFGFRKPPGHPGKWGE